jgi:hypothetical protein
VRCVSATNCSLCHAEGCSWGQKYRVHKGDLILRLLDCIVTISFGVYLVLWLFCCVWVSVSGGVVCVGVLVILYIVRTVFLYCFVYVYLFLFVLSVLV